jgi:hypothetical protein
MLEVEVRRYAPTAAPEIERQQAEEQRHREEAQLRRYQEQMQQVRHQRAPTRDPSHAL